MLLPVQNLHADDGLIDEHPEAIEHGAPTGFWPRAKPNACGED